MSFFKKTVLVIFVCVICARLDAQTRIAILGDLNKNRAEIDVLTEKLSKESGIVLVERSDIEKVLREQEIAAFGTSSAVDSLKTGHLLGAQGVIIVKALDFEGGSLLSARLVAVESGAIVNVWVNDPKMHNDSLTWGTAAAHVFIPSLGKLAVSKKDAIPVSILNIRSSWNNESGLRFANKFRLLLELRLMMQKEVFILERWRLGTLQWEKNLQESTEQFWTGAYIVEGRMEKFSVEKDLVEISIFLSRPGQEKPEIIKRSGKLSDPVALVNALSKELLIKMGQHPTDGSLESWKVDIEADAFANEAFWAYRAGQYETSRAAADAAMALGNGDSNLRFVNVKSHLAEFAERNSFSYGRAEQFKVIANANIRSASLTKEKINILINGVQNCKDLAMSSPDNATRWGIYNDWRLLCAETISCAASVLQRIDKDKAYEQEASVLRKLCRDFTHTVGEKGSDSDLIYPFIATYLNRLDCFSEDSDMMLDEYKWVLSLDFPALPIMRLKIRESLFYIYSEMDASSHISQSRNFDDWFKQAEKNGTSVDSKSRSQKSKERRDEWCRQMVSSPKLSDNITGFITRKSSSDIPKLMELYDDNFLRIATGGDSYDCVACIPSLISAISNNSYGFAFGEKFSVETFCSAFRTENPAAVDLPFLLKHLYYSYVKNISPESSHKISASWFEFKKRLMRQNPSAYLINLNTVSNFDDQIETIRKKTLGDVSNPFLWEKTQTKLVLTEKIELPKEISVNFRLKKMSFENGNLIVWGYIERPPRKLQIFYTITPSTWQLCEYRPPTELSGLRIKEEGIFFSSEKYLYYVDENGIIIKTAWGAEWELVADAKLNNPTAGYHAGGSLFVAFGMDTNNLLTSSDAGWRSDIIEIPDGSSNIKYFASNTRRPKVAFFDDCRPYETMTIFGSPDGSTLFFAPYMRPCYKLFSCDLKNPLEWKTSLHQHYGGESKMYENPYDGGVYFSCACGHTGQDLNFSKGSESAKIFEILKETSDLESKAKENIKWSTNSLGAYLFNNNEKTLRRSAYNGKNLVFYRCSYIAAESFLLCFKEGSPNPFKIILENDEKVGGKSLQYYDISIASSKDFLFIFGSCNDQGRYTSRVWTIEWEGILEEINKSASVPEIKIIPSVFVDSTRVTMLAAAGEKILYSVNTDLYENSGKLYSTPFNLNESSRIIACSIKSDTGISSLPQVRNCLKMPLLDSAALKNPLPGLRYACWKGAWENYPVFEKISPYKTGSSGKLDLNSPGMDKYFAVKFSAYIKIPEDGLYRFYIDAKAKAMMKFHGNEVHSRSPAWTRTETSFSVGLKAGYQPVEIYYLQNIGDMELKIEWERDGLARQVLPENIFFIEETPNEKGGK